MTVLTLAAAALAFDDGALPPEAPASTEVSIEVVPMPTRFVRGPALEITEPSSDVFAFAQSIDLQSPVGDNAFLFAQSATVDSPVNGDVLAMAQVVRIDAPVAGDVYAMAERVEITGGGAVAGNVYVGAGTLVVAGPVGGELQAGAGEVRLDAPIGGNVSLDVGSLVFGSDALIGGDLTYESANFVDADRVVEGEIVWTEVAIEAEEPVDEPEPGLFSRVFWWFGWTTWSYLAHLVVGLVLLTLGGSAVGRVGRVLLQQPGRSLGLGFVALIVVPIASMIAMALVIPLPLGLLALMVFLALLYAAQVFTAQALGDQILRRFQPGAIGSPAVSMAVGLAPIVLLASLPWIGTLVWLVATCFGIGAVWTALREPATV